MRVWRPASKFIILICLMVSGPVGATEVSIDAARAIESGRSEIRVNAAKQAPVIDGKLDDEAWQNARLNLSDWVSYNPLRGDTIVQQTEVFVTYDEKNLYFAFRCLDPEPDKIKTSVSRRDGLFSDDWVGLSLDAMGNGQISYDMFVNPSGVQADILDSSASGEDSGVDWVWTSAAQRDERGYSVEIRLPLQSIRFRSGSDVRMGILFWRRVSRLGMSVSWPLIPQGQWVFNGHASMLLGAVKSPLVLEAIPSVTYALNQERSTPTSWGQASSKPDGGVSIKYGLTSSITLDATINPDFSQVESDSFQMQVNERYPVFYSEKRPFFMEGTSLFDIASGPNMTTAVHTRRILDPLFGARLTGTMGKFSFGTLTASDEAPGRPNQDGSPNPFSGENKLFNMGRVTYSLGKGSYLGAIMTDTELGGSFNRVAGGDFFFRVGEPHSFSGSMLSTRSAGNAGDAKSGMAGYLGYRFSNRRFSFNPRIEHYDEDFQMDTAFYKRTGITMGTVYASVSFYPDKEKHPWLKRVTPYFFHNSGRDRNAGGRERFSKAAVEFFLTRQGYINVGYWVGREPWAHRTFKTDGGSAEGNIQLYNWLHFYAGAIYEYAVYYDAANPFQGKSFSYWGGFTLQPSERFTEKISYNTESFKRADTGGRVYQAHLINTRSTYQFNRRLSVRALIQYDSSCRRILTDFLGAYELVPGTVFYAGYGSLIERRGWDDVRQQWSDQGGRYRTTRRGLFFKLSYLVRL